MAYVIGRLLAASGPFHSGEVVQVLESFTEERNKKFHIVKSTLYDKGEITVPAALVRITKVNHHQYR